MRRNKTTKRITIKKKNEYSILIEYTEVKNAALIPKNV